MRLLREPLVHFLIIGLILFAGYGALNPDRIDSDEQQIVVSRSDLLNQMQRQYGAVEIERLERILEQMSLSQRQALIDAYAREEALFREAKAMGLDQQDPVARQRLIRKLEFVATSFVVTDDPLSEEIVRTYFDNHQNDYYQPAEITFTHVFFSYKNRGEEDAKIQAERTLSILNTTQVPFYKSLEYGDPFPYHSNYVNRQADDITSHFGPVMQGQLFQLDPDEHSWKGPFTSPYGEHIVLLTRNESGYVPKLADIRDRVIEDIERSRLEVKSEEAIQAVIRGYKVTVADDLLRQGANDRIDVPGLAK